MKNLFLLFFTLFTYIAISQNFPGESVELLLDKSVKPIEVKPDLQKYAYKNFYQTFDTDTKKLEKIKGKNRVFPTGINLSDYNKLVGTEFKIVKIHEQITSLPSDKNRYYVLELYNNDLGTIYYDYDSKYDFHFELEVIGGLELPSNFYCKSIKTTTDKFTNEITSRSDYSEGFSFIKVNKGGDSKIFLTINEPGSTLNIGKKGVILLLENGKKIEKPNEVIDVKVNGKDYVYSTFFELTKQDIDLIIKNPIIANRLYIYDGEVENGKKLSEYLKCLTQN